MRSLSHPTSRSTPQNRPYALIIALLVSGGFAGCRAPTLVHRGGGTVGALSAAPRCRSARRWTSPIALRSRPTRRRSPNNRVFVHVVDTDEKLMWTDDHDPPTPTTQWKPGQTVEYVRTVFVPVRPYIGGASIHVGLYSPTSQRRLTLSGQDTGQHSYNVASLEILPQSEAVFTVMKDGWHSAETPPNNDQVDGVGRARTRRRSRSRIRRRTPSSTWIWTIRAAPSPTVSMCR